MTKRAWLMMTLPLLALIFNNCAFIKLKEELTIIEKNTGIGGEINSHAAVKHPIIIQLFAEVDGKRQMIGFRIVDKTEGFYLFVVPDGKYYILAFEDANANFAYDAGEYFGAFGKPEQIVIADLQPRQDLHVDVSQTEGFPKGFRTDISTFAAKTFAENVATGTVIGLDDEKFSEETARMGYWQPVTFLKEAGVGIYFLEPYDSDKIPILFVHGASGTPRHFKSLADQIDRDRFQPWFYHYPSGLPLDKISKFLNRLITIIHGDFQFKQLYVTGHSMGGLVSRSFILRNRFGDGNDYIKLFVSISTPWNGHEASQKGVESAPVAIPSWHDMVPDSPFIQEVFSRTLTPQIDYHLIFSHKGDCSVFMDNNDGSVTLRSQLDFRAQKDALSKWGFDNGHVDILSSPQLITEINAIIDRTYRNQKDQKRPFMRLLAN